MAADDDIERSLPRPPAPRPARRDSAIEAALRRFDGVEDPSGAPSRPPSRDAGGAWWSRIGRPQAGALVAAGLVAILALPFAWTSFDPGGHAPAAPAAPAADNYASADIALDQADSAVVSAPAAAPPRTPGGDTPPPHPSAPAAASAVPAPLKAAARAPLPGAAPEPAPAAFRDSAAVAVSEAESPLIVTGARIPAPAAAAPAGIAARSAPAASRAQVRGDWNACTVEDPSRSLAACRGPVDAGARGATGRAAAHLADGLTRAWSGDYDGAIAGFDRAIAAEPRSASAYLNRGLARRRKGETAAALADLDRAVHLAPASARAYYNRAQVFRQRGDLPRARADEARAAALDPRYAALREAGEE